MLRRSYKDSRRALNPLMPACASVLAVCTFAGAQEQPNIEDLLARVGERVAEFYKRALNVVCIETSTVQPLDLNNSPEGLARTVESELRVEEDGSEGPGHYTIVRKVRKVNGRAPREKDKKDRAGCTDPVPRSLEPLTFLLPAQRPEYQFKLAGTAKDRNRTTMTIDFATVNRRSRPELVEDPTGHDDCYDWSGHIASRGRIWVDAGNYDILRVERGLPGPVDVRVPLLIQRRTRLENWVVIVRDDLTIRYKPVVFSDPDDVVLLPESIDSMTVVRGGLQSTRRNQTFSNYQRFVTGGRVIE